MRATTLVFLFLLLTIKENSLPASSSADPSFFLLNKKIAFKSCSESDVTKDQSYIDTAGLKKGSWYSQVIKNIEESEYEIKYDASTRSYTSPNRKQQLKAFYSAGQFTLLPRNEIDKWKLTLQLKGIYSGSKKLYAVSNDPVAIQTGNNIQFNHNNQFITEYINSKEGVRQNFIITQQPAGNPQKINVELEAGKGWFINKVHDKEIHFAKATGNGYDKKITYNDLKAWDASGKELEAAFTINENTINIEVNTNNAIYPVTIDPLSATANWSTESNQADSWYGLAVSSAGDVNGDGYSDLIVGAPGYDNGQSGEGRAFVYHGSATGLSATANWTGEIDQAGAAFGTNVSTAGDVNGDGYSDIIVSGNGNAYVYFGSAAGLSAIANWIGQSGQAGSGLGRVSCAGDVNGDGYSDVIAGASGYDNGEMNEGRALVFYGSATGPTPVAGWTAESNQASAAFGSSVSSAGDINGDGYSDIIIGAPFYSNGQAAEGMAFAYYGSATGLSVTANWTAESNQANANFGTRVSSAGDVNGDGYSDVISGAPYYANGQATEGMAFAYYGSATGISVTANWTAESNQSDAFLGFSVTSAGDINGDGYSEVIIGAWSYTNGQSNEGTAYIFFGSATGLGLTSGWTGEANQANADFGYSVSSAGDINGDGYSDIVAGAWQYDNGQNDEGSAYVYHGGPDGISNPFNSSIESNQVSVNFGLSVSSAGDVNADGYSDIIVGARYFDNGQTDEGAAFIYHGSVNGINPVIQSQLECNVANAFFGKTVASAGDVNGDGYSDVIVTADQYNSGDGTAFIYLGSASGVVTTPQAILLRAAFDWGNICATTAGDVNGDGYSDVIIGSSLFSNGQTQEGGAFIYAGSPSGISTTVQTILESNQASSGFGATAACAGDVNGDGYSDVIVGANSYNNGQVVEGVAFVYHGSSTGINSAYQILLELNQANAHFGSFVASAGDVNGDGYCDVIVGANSFSNGQVLEGGAFIFHGSTTGINPVVQAQLESNQALAQMGNCVASAGDVNGDGYSDVIAGSQWYSNGQSSEGAAFIYAGSATGISPIATAQLEANQASANMGYSVACAGDVNGDGYSDLIVGAHNYDNGQTDEGAAFIYYGNKTGGIRNNLRLYNQDLVTPIQQSSIGPALFGAGLYAKSPLGRQKGKLVWETEKNGQPFSGNPITNSTAFLSQQPSYIDLGVTGTELKHQIAKQFSTRATYIRARVKYDPVTAITGQVYGPWRYPESFLRGNRDIGAIALPVKLISFVALKQDDKVLLKWTTADETPGIEYEVQHSVDGIYFQTIKNVSSIGNSRNEYEWLDNNPSPGKNYYRIRAIENGKDVFTAIRQINFDTNKQFIIYPNPAKSGSQLTIQLTNNSSRRTLWVELFSINGQKKLSSLITPGNSTIYIKLPVLSAGEYVLKLFDNNKEMYSDKLTILQ